MKPKERIKEEFRLAISYLLAEWKETKGLDIEELAERCGVSSRHLQGILSEKEKDGAVRRLKEELSGFFGKSVEDMLTLGRQLFEDKYPPISAQTAWNLLKFELSCNARKLASGHV